MNVCEGCTEKTDGCARGCTRKAANDLANWIANDKLNKARRKQKSLDNAYTELTLKRYRKKNTQWTKF